METKKITCAEYAKELNSRFFFEILMEEMLNAEHFEAYPLFKHMKRQAEIDSVLLLDEEEWDYEQYFDALYSVKESAKN